MWLVPDEAAVQLGLSRAAIYRAAKGGRVRSRRVGGRLEVLVGDEPAGEILARPVARPVSGISAPVSPRTAARHCGPSYAALDQLELERGRFELESMRAEREAACQTQVLAAMRANFEARARVFARTIGLGRELLPQLGADVSELVSVLNQTELAATSAEDLVREVLGNWVKAAHDKRAGMKERQRRARLARDAADAAAANLQQRQVLCLLMMRHAGAGR